MWCKILPFKSRNFLCLNVTVNINFFFNLLFSRFLFTLLTSFVIFFCYLLLLSSFVNFFCYLLLLSSFVIFFCYLLLLISFSVK
ncbi:hypothetical protein FQU78_06810 [Methanosarcina mazei]|uniref:Uncharacterized protein n=1 Tax=Methanosarcina mazei TaxID=2209 RepID=A0A6C0VI04_METMZ|nr:hypothetical protein FQU78_06810 [Methanosarcina mazei]